jgi:hypothetical protein
MAKQPANSADTKQQDVSLFLNKIFFFVLFFILLVMIASFGIIAEV